MKENNFFILEQKPKEQKIPNEFDTKEQKQENKN
jgi:hypothetical protein